MSDDWLARSGLRTRAVHGGVVPDPITRAIAPVISPGGQLRRLVWGDRALGGCRQW